MPTLKLFGLNRQESKSFKMKKSLKQKEFTHEIPDKKEQNIVLGLTRFSIFSYDKFGIFFINLCMKP